ncbi:methyl-CpG-binding domain-containing protein 2-like [Solanum pennellii]|uniref:Methyl-CpG-binding domain-containing protein 2-like n=1 Tax=Solanum pennellii TaxID=28526 RepID=A0ABM1GKQ9_SOLPN|nr:methyl-CpG-binding domain-containing protein 2-like [Solanum pennellii]
MERDQDAHLKKKVADEMEFAVQCSKCFKWRYIPTEERYEKIREHLLECPFYCEDAREWRPSISCNDIPDITQKEKKLSAFDKPGIPQPPSGWKRIVKVRTRGTIFADVYYDSPNEKRLRSIPEVERYLKQHSEYASQGVKLKKFSFKTPRSLQQDYAKKRSPTPPTPSDDINGDNAGMSM